MAANSPGLSISWMPPPGNGINCAARREGKWTTVVTWWMEGRSGHFRSGSSHLGGGRRWMRGRSQGRAPRLPADWLVNLPISLNGRPRDLDREIRDHVGRDKNGDLSPWQRTPGGTTGRLTIGSKPPGSATRGRVASRPRWRSHCCGEVSWSSWRLVTKAGRYSQKSLCMSKAFLICIYPRSSKRRKYTLYMLEEGHPGSISYNFLCSTHIIWACDLKDNMNW